MKNKIMVMILAFVLLFSVNVFASGDIYQAEIGVTFSQTDARSMLELVNTFRTGEESWYYNPDGSKYNCNLSELTYDYALEEVAMQRAAEIAIAFGHARPDGTSCFAAYNELGYYCNAKSENIAVGYRSAEAVYRAWREDDVDYSGQGHRRSMLGSGYRAIGIGHVIYNGVDYWVQEFSDTVINSISAEEFDGDYIVDVNIDNSFITSITLCYENEEGLTNLHCGDYLDLEIKGVDITLSGYDYKGNTCSSWGGVKTVHPYITLQEDGDHIFCNDEEGYIYVCGTGNTQLIVTALGYYTALDATSTHNPGAPVGAVEATCTTNGMTGDVYCLGCDELLSSNEVILAKGHNIVTDKAVAATYKSTGLTQGSHCSNCGEIFEEQKIVSRKTLTKTSISSIKNTTNGIKIEWSKVTGAEGYYLYRNNKLIATIKNGNTPLFLDKTAVNGAKYSYTVKAFAGNNISSASKAKLTYRIQTLVISSAKNNSKNAITVIWKKIANVSGYEIKIVEGGKAKTYTVNKDSTVKKIIYSFKKGRAYTVSIRAYKKISDVKYYSAWSTSKLVKISK